MWFRRVEGCYIEAVLHFANQLKTRSVRVFSYMHSFPVALRFG